MKITAISGWALPCDWFAEQIAARFENSRVQVIYPENPLDAEEARRLLAGAPADLYLGYSLGSLWLLTYRDFLPAPAVKAILAPILAFTREQDRGGKTSGTQLKYLIKVLTRSSENNSPLIDFYANCDFPYPPSLLKDLPERSVLIEGLKFLQSVSVDPESAQDFQVIMGEKDVLLDAEKLRSLMPQLQIVEGAGHTPAPLLEHLANTLILRDQKA